MKWVIWLSTCCWLVGSALAEDSVRQTLDLNEKLPGAVTTIWTPGFQRCWDEIRDWPGFEQVEPTGAFRMLDAFEWDAEATIPRGSAVTVAHAIGPEFARLANRMLAENFGEGAPRLDPAKWPASINGQPLNGIACLTVMKRAVTFETPFKEHAPGPMRFETGSGRTVFARCFGSYAKLRPQHAGAGWVLSYEPAKRLALRLKLAEKDEAMFLLLDSEVQTFQGAIDAIRDLGANAKQPGAEVDADDTILIPYLTILDQHNFLPLLNGEFVTADTPVTQRFHAAIQRVEIGLNEEGAKMETRSFLIPPGFLSAGGGGGRIGAGTPRKLVFDEPFFLMLWRKGGTHPYLVCHVDGGGLELVDPR